VIVIATCSTTVPPVTLVVVPVLVVTVVVVKLALVKPVTLHLPLATTGCGVPFPGARDWKRVKEPPPRS
jgi:hypothetical protein